MPIHYNKNAGSFNGNGMSLHLKYQLTEAAASEIVEITSKGATNIRDGYASFRAYLNLVIDDQNTTRDVPSGYIQAVLAGMLDGFAIAASGGTRTASWEKVPWWLDMQGMPKEKRVLLTLRNPKQKLLDNVSVPLRPFGSEIIRLGKSWMTFLEETFPTEINDPTWGDPYRLFRLYYHKAEWMLRKMQRG